MAKAGDSAIQREAEIEILGLLSDEMGLTLSPAVIDVGSDDVVQVQVDGVSSDGRVLVEAFARQGRLKTGQTGKVARDVLKLITLARNRPDSTLILAVADQVVADQLTGPNWLSWALDEWGINVVVVELSAETAAAIRGAQTDQRR